jgi:hypothetical protein
VTLQDEKELSVNKLDLDLDDLSIRVSADDDEDDDEEGGYYPMLITAE